MMATGQRYFPPVSFAVDTNGVPLAGALLYFYITGTDTLLNTYSDVNLTIPNANPVEADTNGQWPSIFMSSALYKVRLFDSEGNEVWTRDPVFVSVQAVGEFLSGVRLLFPQAAAPTGWTQVTTINDRVLRVVSTAGAGIGGSWTISGLGGTVAGHVLTIAELAAHTHTLTAVGGSLAPGPDQGSSGAGTASTLTTSSVGTNSAHSHGFTASSDGTWRPSYLNIIIASKD